MLDTAPEESYDVIVRTAAQLTGCPIAVLTLVDEHRQWFKATHGLALRETPREVAFCAHTILGDALFEVGDACSDRRFHDNPLVLGPPHQRFYAGVPLRFAGVKLGALAVIDHAPRTLDAARRSALEGLARVAGELLRGRRRLVSLHEERTRLHDLARASGDWMWETDEDLRYRWISGQFEPVTGIPSNALLGRRVDDAPVLDAQGDPLPGNPGLLALLRGREALSRVITLKRTPRGELHVSRSALPVFDDHGHFRGWRGTARDVSAQIAAQRLAAQRDELLRKLSSQIPGAMFQYLRHADGRGSFPYVSNGVKALFGVSAEAAQADPMRVFRRVHPDDIDALRDAVERSAQTLGLWHGEYRVLEDDGRVRWIEMRASPERLADGSVRWHAFCADVTQQAAIDQMRRDKEGAERANRAKSEFLSRMSHELRTPLNSILGFAQLMALDREHPLAADQQRRLDGVHRAGRHLLGLINDVLDLARIEQEDFSPKLEAVDAAEALTGCVALIQPLARESGIELPASRVLPACWVQADQRALEQVLMNLLSNAIKYNRPGGRVGAAIVVADGEARISISDQGAGLSEAQQAQLFQHFARLGAEDSRVEGTGLGLVISRALAQAMNARLEVRSAPGAGSTFTLALPTSAAAPGPAPAPTAALTAPAPTSTLRQRVLYIEDEPLNVLLMQEVFRARPEWSLEVAVNGAQGLRLAREQAPDLLLIDMNLPDMGGIDLIRALRRDARTGGLRCIALSADAMGEQIAAARAAGFDDYWTKPIDVPRVLADLGAVLAGP